MNSHHAQPSLVAPTPKRGAADLQSLDDFLKGVKLLRAAAARLVTCFHFSIIWRWVISWNVLNHGWAPLFVIRDGLNGSQGRTLGGMFAGEVQWPMQTMIRQYGLVGDLLLPAENLLRATNQPPSSPEPQTGRQSELRLEELWTTQVSTRCAKEHPRSRPSGFTNCLRTDATLMRAL